MLIHVLLGKSYTNILTKFQEIFIIHDLCILWDYYTLIDDRYEQNLYIWY